MAEDWAEPEENFGDRLNPRDIVNHLLIIWVVEYVSHSPTVHSRPDRPSDLIVVDVVDLDAADEEGYQGALFRHVWWRQARLIAKLRTRIGQRMLCYMTTAAPRPGFNAAFEVVSALSDPAAMARGEAWVKAHPDFKPSLPQSTTTPNGQLNDPWTPSRRTEVPSPQPQPQPKSYLEQFAEQATRNAERLPPPPPPRPRPSDIPF